MLRTVFSAALKFLVLLVFASLSATANAHAPVTPEGVWFVGGLPGSASMVFEPEGALAFRDSFELFNPARWSLGDRVLTITLGGESALPSDTQGVLSVNPATRTIRYHYPRCTKSLQFFGFVYSRADTFVCLDADYSR